MLNSVMVKSVGGFFVAMLAGLIWLNSKTSVPNPANAFVKKQILAESPKPSPEKETHIVERVVFKEKPIPPEYEQAWRLLKK